MSRKIRAPKKFSCTNILDFIEALNISEQNLYSQLQDFECTPNRDVENFLKKNAIEFTKKHQSVTYLVYPVDEALTVGYFALTIKPLTIRRTDIPSNTIKRMIERMCRLDEITQSYTLAAYLIAQLGKNFCDGINELISGRELLNIALEVVKDMQYRAGGTVVFIETDDSPKLLDFYQANHFHLLEERKDTSSGELVQMFRVI